MRNIVELYNNINLDAWASNGIALLQEFFASRASAVSHPLFFKFFGVRIGMLSVENIFETTASPMLNRLKQQQV